jgi:prepilin-type N-terminal cleavage/methylation domain-containing protein
MDGSVPRSPSFAMSACAKRAYTLIEVLIVLVLLTTITLLITMALDIHMRQMVVSNTEVEEAQLAHAVLAKIAQDIHSVVVAIRVENLEVDASAITSVMGLDGVGDLLGDLDLGDLEGTEETEDEDMPLIYGEMPGIYGDIEWIQIDTAKLPRGEMFGSKQTRRGTSMASDRLSATKTVLYYLGRDTEQLAITDPRYQPENLIGAIGRSLDPSAAQYGLFRRQLDRQASQYMLLEGLEAEYEQDDEPLAPEVVWIEFAYFDPTAGTLGETGAWIDSWDMDDRQMLPLAVRITVAIRRPNFGRSLFALGTPAEPQVVTYSKIVMIPVTVDVIYDEEEEWDEYLDYL